MSLRVGKGEIVALVGPNGAGKTALVSSIAVLIPRRNGSLSMNGVELVGMPSWRVGAHGVAIVLKGRRLFATMSVADNLDIGTFRADAWSKRKVALKQVFTLFPILAERRKQAAGTLSGGSSRWLRSAGR